MKKIGIIFNKNSGSFRELSQKPEVLIETILSDNKQDECDLHIKVVSGKDIPKTVQSLISEHYDVIVAAGGDGTINSIATLLKDTDVPLGVVPMGTYNHFAKDAGVPLDLEGAVLNLINGSEARIDYGTVNEKVFLNNSSLGYYPISIIERDKVTISGKIQKKIRMVLSLLKTLVRFPLLEVETDKSPEKRPIKSSIIFIGNNHYDLSRASLGQRTGLSDGKLSAYISTCTNVSCVFT